MRLDKKVAIVTGSARGLGREFARSLAQEGARICAADIDLEGAEETAQSIRSIGNEAFATRVDVRLENDCKRMADLTFNRFGSINVLVNNAAIYYGIVKKPFHDVTVEEWDNMMNVNIRGQWLCSKAVFPYMAKHGGGKIINVSSGTPFQGTPNMIHYVTSKAAVIGFTRALARELGAHNINVNTLAPGMTMTEATKSISTEQMIESAEQRRCIKRRELPEDLAGAIKFLASSESDFITGQTISVDGGASFV